MNLVCGIDEAGRGALAGPVSAAAVVLAPKSPLRRVVHDSKTLSPKRRTELCLAIREEALLWAVGWAWPKEIDRLNIHYASLLAMERAFSLIEDSNQITRVEVDGKFVPTLGRWKGPVEAVVKGDSLVPEIGAASILAKVYRDTLMEHYGTLYPSWEFSRHKGYPTRLHKEICAKIGLSPIHRKSFTIR